MKTINLEHVKVMIDGNASVLPDWARAAIHLGAYARYASDVNNKNRLLIFCVVPCRDVFTALVGLGSVIAGGLVFRKSFCWEDLKNLELGTTIFWKHKDENHNYSGVLEEHVEMGGQTLVPVNITKPQRKKGLWYFSELKFGDCVFSEENLPSAQATDWLKSVESFYSSLGVSSVSKWVVTAGAEVRFITNNTHFRRTLENWMISTDLDCDAVKPAHLMILRDEKEAVFAKSRITHHSARLERKYPVTILDGPLAFQCLADIDFGSLVIVLEEGELAHEHTDFLLQASSEHIVGSESLFSEFSLSGIPPTIEVTGYYLKVA